MILGKASLHEQSLDELTYSISKTTNFLLSLQLAKTLFNRFQGKSL